MTGRFRFRTEPTLALGPPVWEGQDGGWCLGTPTHNDTHMTTVARLGRGSPITGQLPGLAQQVSSLTLTCLLTTGHARCFPRRRLGHHQVREVAGQVVHLCYQTLVEADSASSITGRIAWFTNSQSSCVRCWRARVGCLLICVPGPAVCQ